MEFDEDYGYERQRQRKADYGIHRPQRYERVDTHKRIPFATPHMPKPTKVEMIVAVITVAMWAFVAYNYWPSK